MSRNQLIFKLYAVANSSLSSANKGNPFISKSTAMHCINEARMGRVDNNAIVLMR